MPAWRKRLLLLGVALLFVGLACLALPPYSQYCEGHYANKYNCAAYDVALTFGGWFDMHNGAITALFTFVLAISTILLWEVTAKSAAVAERALTELEAPFLTVEVLGSGLAFTPTGDVTSPVSDFTYKFINHGRTTAQLTELVETWPIVDRRDAGENDAGVRTWTSILPEPIDPAAQTGRAFPFGVVSTERHPYELRANAIVVIDIQKLNVRPWFRDGGNDLFFQGFVRYRDIFGKRYVMGFCLQYDHAGRRFVPMGDERYNYARKET